MFRGFQSILDQVEAPSEIDTLSEACTEGTSHPLPADLDARIGGLDSESVNTHEGDVSPSIVRAAIEDASFALGSCARCPAALGTAWVGSTFREG